MHTITQIYKYTTKAHAKSMLEDGKFRIGTLHEFRDIEKHGAEKGDEKEGTKSIFAENVNFDTSRPETTENLPDFIKNMFSVPASSKGSIKISASTFERKTSSQDLFIFSASEIWNSKTMKELGYETCIVIKQPIKFLQELTNSLKQLNLIKDMAVFGRCIYKERKEHHTEATQTHPALIKEPRYSYQKEVRGIWLPISQSIEGVIVENKNARKYLEDLNYNT